MNILKNFVAVGLTTLFASSAVLAQSNSKASATSTTYSTSNRPFAEVPLIVTTKSQSRAEVSASLHDLGLSKVELGHTAQGRALILKAIKTDKSNASARVDYAYLALQDNKPHKAEYQIAKAQELLTTCVDVSEGYCDVLKGRLNKLEAVYEQSQFK